MQQILEIINAIATPELLDKLNYVKQSSNRPVDPNKYRDTLMEWFLHSEVYLVDNHDDLVDRLQTRADRRIFRQSVFNGQGKYNIYRYTHLSKLL